MKASFTKFALLLAAVVLFGSSALADSLAPGGSAIPTSLSALPSGLTLLASTTSSYSLTGAAGTATGSATASVYMTSGGTLDFTYQVTNAGTSTDLIDTLSMASFGGFATDVDYVNVAGWNAPSLSTRPGATGNVVNFDFFPNDINPGDTSDVLLIETNATTYKAGSLSLIDSGVATVPAYEPSGTATAPEPSSLLMLGSGLFGLVAFRRRRTA